MLADEEEEESGCRGSHLLFKLKRRYLYDEQAPVWFQWLLFVQRRSIFFLNESEHLVEMSSVSLMDRINVNLHIKYTTWLSFCTLSMKVWLISVLYNMNMYTTGMARQLLRSPPLYTSLLPCILTSLFLPHWEDIWSPTRPALCSPPPPLSLHPFLLPSSVVLYLHRDPLRHRLGIQVTHRQLSVRARDLFSLIMHTVTPPPARG